MNRGMAFVLVGLGVAGLLVTYILVTGFDAPAAVESGLQSVREMVSAPPPAEDEAGEAEADAEAAEPAAPARPAPAAAAPTEERVVVADPPAPPPVPVPVDDDPAGAAAPPMSAPSGRAPLNRSAHYLPGNYATWTEFDVDITTPVVLRAGGVVSAAPAVAGPGGVTAATPTGASAGDRLVLPGAPYLALIGRVCSDAECTAPFLVGTDTTLCPSALGISGQLQLLTNNYVRVGGRQTASTYSTTTGGYAFYTEPAPESACAEGAPATPVRQDSAALAAGEVLRKPEFSLSSGLTFWKPFFVPMGTPFVIRASGRIESTSGRPEASPDGVDIPVSRRWWAEMSDTTSTRRRGQLFIASMPYHALIGRLCGAGGCGAPFLVGSEKVICPSASHGDRIELWINRVIAAPGMLDNQTPMTFEMFDVQTQRGSFSFEVAPAPAGACGG